MSVLLRSMNSPRAQAMFLRTLPAIRSRCAQVHDLAKKGALQYFDYDPGKLDAVIEFCAAIMEVRPVAVLPPRVFLFSQSHRLFCFCAPPFRLPF